MAIFKKGTLSVVANTTAQNLILGFVPSYFRMENFTKIVGNTNGIQIVEWWNDMPNASAYLWTTASGVPTISYISSNGITPYFPSDASLYVPTNLVITGISKAAQASITATHNFTSQDIGVTVVSFHNVVGMTQINTRSGVIQSVTSTTSFTVNINSTNFTTFVNSGSPVANVVTGRPALQGGSLSSGNALAFSPVQQGSSQVLNTALFNNGGLGLILGSGVMISAADVWQYEAVLDADFTSA